MWETSRKKFCIACSKSVLKNIVLSQTERAWYFNSQQHRESVNINAFDQSEHDETVESTACLQAPPSFSPLKCAPRLASLADFFCCFTLFFAFFPHCGVWSQAYTRHALWIKHNSAPCIVIQLFATIVITTQIGCQETKNAPDITLDDVKADIDQTP